ncbi:hypothetical protein [Saccharothrix deserti]|uniref:hypothetical protein n=1 Tax=Saccharothrix deserti TaxID=2593674 RepID=UPI001EE4A481|nr:hypothetical protein [Saccharothrix deserti]
MLQAQDLVLDVINEEKAQFGIYATNPLPASTALSDLRALAGRILSHAERGDLNSMPRDLLADYDHAMAQPAGHNKPAHAIARPGAMAPAHAAITALGVTAAVTVLNSNTVRDAGTAIRWLIETSRQRGSTVTPSNIGSWGRGSSTTLKAVQLSALGPFLKPSDQLRYRTAADTPSHRLPADRALSRHHRIPARLWTTWALRLQPGTWPSLRILRPALSAALLLAGTRRTLSDATETLGAIIDSHDVSRSLMALEASPHWSHILIALTRLVDHLDAGDIPIDYHRRRELNYDDLLPADQWIIFCRQTGFLTGQQRRLQLARCLLFEKISNMPAEKAPDSFRIDRSFNREQLHQFAARITPDLAEHLNAAAQDFLAHQGIAGEPVEWQPPVTLLDDLQLPGDTPTAVDINTLHRLVRDGRTSLSAAAQQLGTTLDVVRHLLDQHPAPALPPTTSEQARATGQLRFAARTALPRELLTRLYCDQQHTLREIGRRIGVSRNIVSALLDEYAIPRRQHNGPRPTIMISRDWLYDQYINHRRTLPDLARETGMSPSNMTRWAKRHNIPLRSRGGTSHSRAQRPDPT